MARRTERAHARSQARKLRIATEGPFPPTHKWRNCELCGSSYCCNNYQDGKTRIYRWREIEICAFCRYNCIKYIPKLQKLGAIRKDKKK